MSLPDDGHYLKAELYKKVREDEDIFEFLQGGSLDGIWYWDLDAPAYEWMSPEFWKTLGYDPESKPHLAAAWQKLINQEDLELVLENFKRHCADPNHPYDQIVRYLHADGSTVWIRCRGLAIRDETGKPIRMLGAHTDITQLKLLQAEELTLNDRVRQISESNEHLEEFAFVASHDLNAPLRRISSFLDLITVKVEQYGDEELLSWMESVNGNAVYMQRMVDDLLELSRITVPELEVEMLDLGEIAKQVVAHLQADNQDWTGTITIEALPTITGIRTLITRLFQNLIKNAMIYSKPEGATLKIYGSKVGLETVLHFEDNGIGIDAKYHEAVFELFKRLHSRQQYGGGTGMGLAICKRISKRHNGDIKIDSEVDRGTLVTVHFNGENKDHTGRSDVG